MVATTTATRPIDRMLDAFPGLRQRSNGWWAHEDSPRFDCLELSNGDIRIHSHTGRSSVDVLAMGDPAHPISYGQLFAHPGQWSGAQAARDKLDLLTLADYMRIDWQFLEQEGYSDGYTYTYSSTGNTVRCVKVGGCFTPDGKEHSKVQVRLSLHENPRFLFDQNTPGHPLPFGLHHLDRARNAGYLVIGEGSSDFATMTFHGIPFIGLPGASHAGSLDVARVKDIPTLYIIEEPDQVKSLMKKGMGFYKSVRKHLRDNGYDGEIFSIRFEDATGFKDPSDLHKSIYSACKEVAEGPFRQEVQKRFLEAIESALAGAIPEGDTSRVRALVRDLSHMSFEQFYREVWEVPTSFLSPIQKGIVCYLFLYMRDTEPGELGWRFDARELAPRMGFIGTKAVKTLQGHISYLHQKVGIIGKQHRARKEYLNGEEGNAEHVRYKGTDLYIQPSPGFFTPRGYCVPTADQHQSGGPRVPQEECEYCGGRHLKHYARQCVECGHVMYPPINPIQEEPEPFSPQPQHQEEAQSEPVVVVVESTLSEPIAVVEGGEIEVFPEVPKMGTSDNKDSIITDTQNGYLGKWDEEQFSFPPPTRSHPAPYDKNGLPARMTMCCKFPFQMGRDGPECSNPVCPEKEKRKAS